MSFNQQKPYSAAACSIIQKEADYKHEQEVAALKEENAQLKKEMEYYKRWFGKVE